MNCKAKNKLEERQAAMRQRHAKTRVVDIPHTLLQQACDIYLREIYANGGAALSEHVTACLVRAGIGHSVAEEARRLLGVVEWTRPATGEAWLHVDAKKAA